MKFLRVLASVAFVTFAGANASQAATYSFDYTSVWASNGPLHASGFLTTNSGINITGISGTVNGMLIEGLIDSPYGVPTNGIIYISPSAFLTDFAFSAVDGERFEVGNYYDDLLNINYPAAYGKSTLPNLTIGQLSVSQVPLPASLPLYGTAVLVLGFCGLKKRRRKGA